jgi:hypothetical protein
MLNDLYKNSKKTSIGFHILVPNWLSTGITNTILLYDLERGISVKVRYVSS